MINYKDLFEFDFWANCEVIKYVSSSKVKKEKALSIMSHILNAYVLWIGRIKNIPQNTGVWQIYDKSELTDKNLEIRKMMSDFLFDREFYPDKIVTYKNTKGENYDSTVEDILFHLFNHSSYHRGQVIHLLSSSGNDFPYIDYIHYVRNIKK